MNIKMIKLVFLEAMLKNIKNKFFNFKYYHGIINNIINIKNFIKQNEVGRNIFLKLMTLR